MPKPKHDPTLTYDCPYCGATYWFKEKDPVPPCTCGCRLIRRREEREPQASVIWLQFGTRLEAGWWIDLDDLDAFLEDFN